MSPAGRRPRLASLLLGMYPPAWRARYGEELLAVVDQGGLGAARALGLARGALDARLHPDLFEKGLIRMGDRLRGSLLSVLSGYAIFVVAGLGYQKLTEYDDFTDAARQHAVIGATLRLVVAASLVALVAMVVAYAPIGAAAVRQALAGSRELRRPLALLGVAVLWLGATVALLVWRGHSAPPPAGQMSSTADFLAWAASLLPPVVAGVAAAGATVRRGDPGLAVLRFSAVAVAVAAGAMLLMLAATVVWGIALHAADPSLFHSNQGLRSTSTAGTWAAIVVLMAAATALAARSSASALAARRRPA